MDRCDCFFVLLVLLLVSLYSDDPEDVGNGKFTFLFRIWYFNAIQGILVAALLYASLICIIERVCM